MATSGLESLSRFFGGLRWLFMPLGLFALVAVGVHAAADVVDDSILRGVEWLDAMFDGVLAKFDSTAPWVNRIDSKERTVIARGVAFSWELCVDFFVALPALGYGERDANERKFAVTRETWRTLLARLNQQPTPMRLIRPVVTAIFVFGGAYAVSRLVESTLFVGLVGDVAPADVSAWLARVAGGTAMTVVLFSHGWRAVLRAMQHADAVCARSKHPWWSGIWGSAFSLPLAVALVMEAGAVLSFFR
ncbi:MAG: hypothetical protein ACO1OB_25730 [Archangium sp.]